ncbi:MAG: gliding motility-associated C-terminal domain-containing protein, partial [Bacteroidales bacterium]|nr:gliding motility-associated C-terminal domain-containing protein [Bacteroidales bacterium]
NGSCAEDTDDMILTITPVPVANAGPNAETCAGSNYTFPAGAATATNYSSISWSTSGTGSFTNGTTLTPTYNPSAADISAGSVTLTLHAAGNGSCAEDTDDMILTITPVPVANAGPNGETCAGSSYTFGAGDATTTNSAGFYWTTSGTGFFANGTTLTPTYNPSAADIAAGSVTITLHAVGNGSCTEDTDDMILTITQAPTAYAGSDGTICFGGNFKVSDASVTNSTGITWLTSGDGIFDDPNIIDPVYTPGPTDLLSGNVVLYIQSSGTGSCSDAVDSARITIMPELIVSVGAPSPYTISENTHITVSIGAELHHFLDDLSYYLMAPDGTTITLKQASTFFWCNYSVDADLTFTTDTATYPPLSICKADPFDGIPLTGTYGFDGDWSALYGMDPANGAWRVMVEDCDPDGYSTDGFLSYAEITFTDTTAAGDTITLKYNSGAISEPIYDPEFTCAQTTYQVPLGLVTSCHNTCDASAVVTITGGSGSYSIEWSHGPTDLTLDLCEGTYSVTVTDDMGCTDVTTVEVTSPPEIVINTFTSTDSLLCAEDSNAVINVTASGGTGSLTYSLLHESVFYESSTTGLFEDLPGGNYTVEITDINGCPKDTTIFIYQPESITIDTFEVDSISCFGLSDGEIRITAQGGTPQYVYSIEPGVEVNNDGIFSNLFAGKYIIRITDSHDCDTVKSDTIFVFEPSELLIDSVTVNPIICNSGQGSIQIYASGGTPAYEGSINGGTNYFPSLIFNNLGPGINDIALKDANGCEVFYPTPAILTDPPPIVIDSFAVENVTGCYGDNNGSIYVEASGGLGIIEYSIDGINYQPTGLFTGRFGGQDTLYIRDSILGCTLVLDTITINEPAQLMANITSTPVMGAVEGTITIEAVGGTPPYLYSIDNGATTQDTGYFDSLSIGIYQIYLEDANGCIYTDTYSLTENLLSVMYLSIKDVSCYGLTDGLISLVATDGVGPYEYSYNGEPPQVIGSAPCNFSSLAAGDYNILVEDSEGRLFTDLITIQEPPEIILDAIVTNSTCKNYSEDGAIQLVVTGGTGMYEYVWKDSTLTDTISRNDLVIDLNPGIYFVTVQDENSCTASRTDTVFFDSEIIAFAGNDTIICYGSTYNLIGSGGLLFQWSPDSLFENSTDQIQTITAYYDQTYVLLTSTANCYELDTVTIEVFDTVGMHLGPDKYITEGESVELSASDGFISYYWLPADYLSDPATQITIATPPGNQPYIAYGITSDGCTESDTIYIQLRSIIEEIFSGFTPNGDGINDTWRIPNAYQYENIEVEIFNRWGNRVFHSKGYSSDKEWNGTYNGKELPIGTYYYIIHPNDGVTEPKTGTVTIVR